MRNDYIILLDNLNDDAIREKEDLQCVVRLIATLLNNKIQYYGDRVPDDFNDQQHSIGEYIKSIGDSSEKLSELENLKQLKDIVDKVNRLEHIAEQIDRLEQREDISSKVNVIEDTIKNQNDKIDTLIVALNTIKNKLENDNSKQELINEIQEKNKTLQDKLQSQINQIQSDMNELKSCLEIQKGEEGEEDMNLFRSIKKFLKSIDGGHRERIGAIQRTQSTQDSQITSINNQLMSLRSQLAEQQSVAKDWQNKFESEQSKCRDLSTECKQLNEKNQNLDNALKEEQKIKQELEDKLREEIKAITEKKDNQIQAITTERNNKDEEIKELQEKLEMANSAKVSAEEKLKPLEQYKLDNETTIDNLKTTNNEWENLTAIYKPVIEGLQHCDTFHSLLEENQISFNGIKPEDLFKIATLIGRSIEFAKEVHNCALKVKQSNNEAMTQTEVKLYDSLNKCYRKIWNIDFDIFVLPGGKSINEEFTKIPFNKSEVVYMKNPRDKMSKYTQMVYVPLLKAQNGNIHTLAQVQAGNM